MQQGVIDTQTLRENLDGLDNTTVIEERIISEKAEKVLFESLMAQAAQGNPKATMAAAEIRKNPGQMSQILDKYGEPEEEITPEEGAMVAPQQGMPQQEPDIASVLAGMGAAPPQAGGPLG